MNKVNEIFTKGVENTIKGKAIPVRDREGP
jgi:hypothetical protein